MACFLRIIERVLFLAAFLLLQECIPQSKFGKKKIVDPQAIRTPADIEDIEIDEDVTEEAPEEEENSPPAIDEVTQNPPQSEPPTQEPPAQEPPVQEAPVQEPSTQLPPVQSPPVPHPAYFVSTYGNDANDGQLHSPFKTIHKALQAAANSNTKNIVVRAGIYSIRRQSPIVMNSSHDGIKLMGYPGESPIISGGSRITGFTKVAQSQLWVAPVPATVEDLIGGITVDGATYIQARHPNINESAPNPKATGWLFTEKVILPAGSPNYQEWDFYAANTFQYRSGDLSSQWLSGERVRFVFWDKLGWASDIPELETHTSNTRTIKLKQNVQFGIDHKTRYYIMGSRKALDAPGEFYHDKANGQLLIYPRENFGESSAVYATSDGYYTPKLVVLENTRNVTIQGITFRDQFALPWWGRDEKAGILIKGGSKNIVRNCRFTALSKGVFIQDSSDNTIMENYMHDLVADAISLMGESHGNQIVANHLTRFGQPNGRSHGVEVEHGANRIAYNLIEDADQYAINTGGEKAGEGIVIEKNIIRNGCRLSRDCGIIYMKNGGRYVKRDVVRYNLIEKSNGMSVSNSLSIVENDLSWGIYMDESQSGTDVYGNIIRNTVDGAIMIHKGWDNVVSNNIFIDAKNSQYRIDNVESSRQATNKIEKNIITFNNPSAKVASFKNYSSGATIDRNFYFYRSNSSASYFLDNIYTFGGTFRNWISQYGKDRNSAMGDASFENFAESNFLLKAASPAFNVGFQQIPVNDIGLSAYERSVGYKLSFPGTH